MKLRCALLMVPVLVGCLGAAAFGQGAIAGFGPLDPAPPKDMTAQQIIDKFAARESVFRKARGELRFSADGEDRHAGRRYQQGGW